MPTLRPTTARASTKPCVPGWCAEQAWLGQPADQHQGVDPHITAPQPPAYDVQVGVALVVASGWGMSNLTRSTCVESSSQTTRWDSASWDGASRVLPTPSFGSCPRAAEVDHPRAQSRDSHCRRCTRGGYRRLSRKAVQPSGSLPLQSWPCRAGTMRAVVHAGLSELKICN